MAGRPADGENRCRLAWWLETCGVLVCGMLVLSCGVLVCGVSAGGISAGAAPRQRTSGQDGPPPWTNHDDPACLWRRQMPKVGWGGHRPVPGLGSASRAHLFVGLADLVAGLATFVAGFVASIVAGLAGVVIGLATGLAGEVAGLVAGLAGEVAGLATGLAGGVDVVRTTVKAGPDRAGVATPSTLPSESRRKAADCAGTIPMLAALDARLAGDCATSRDCSRAS